MPSSPDQRKRVLVTGGAGYIGSHVLLELLLHGGYLPVVLDNLCNSNVISVQRVQQLAAELTGNPDLPQVDVHIVDLTVRKDVDRVFASYKDYGGIWGVVHLAALKAVGDSVVSPLAYYSNNITGLVHLLEAMHTHGTNNIVYSSSASVYGTQASPVRETAICVPESPYGRTKAMGEQILADAAVAYPEFKVCSLRYFNPAGAHPSGQIGEDSGTKPANLVPLLSAIAVGKYRAEGFKVFGNDYDTPDGTGVRDFIHVVDLARGHVQALDAIGDGRILGQGKENYRDYNLGRGEGNSVLDVVREMRKVSGVDFQYDVAPRRPGDIGELTADPSRAQEEFGFVAERGLEECCVDLWRWTASKPDGYSTALNTPPTSPSTAQHAKFI